MTDVPRRGRASLAFSFLVQGVAFALHTEVATAGLVEPQWVHFAAERAELQL